MRRGRYFTAVKFTALIVVNFTGKWSKKFTVVKLRSNNGFLWA